MSKSGLFAHFRSKRALELATLERAREMFAEGVLRPAQESPTGIKRLWRLCDLWLDHVEQRVFPGGFFFTGAFFTYTGRRGPVAGAIHSAAQEWIDTLKLAIQEAQKQGQIDPDAEAKRLAWELNARLVGAHWVYLLEGDGRFSKVREALLGRLHDLATDKIPGDAFDSLRSWKHYLEGEH